MMPNAAARSSLMPSLLFFTPFMSRQPSIAAWNSKKVRRFISSGEQQMAGPAL